MTVWIYALCEQDLTPRYVGSSIAPGKRLAQHLSAVRNCNKPKREWLAGLGGPPRLILLQPVRSDMRVSAERRWIARLGRRFQLLNIAKPIASRPAVPRICPAPGAHESAAIARAQQGLHLSRREAAAVMAVALRLALVDAGMTVSEAAVECGVVRSTIVRMMTGSPDRILSRVLCSFRIRELFISELVDALETEQADDGRSAQMTAGYVLRARRHPKSLRSSYVARKRSRRSGQECHS